MEPSESPVTAEWPRYSTTAFPTYRFLPGLTPHPRRDPQGHSFGRPEPRPLPFVYNTWSASEEYLYAVDLYNFAYWWESHEVFEGLWHACGRKTTAGNFFQALIQFAAANLKRTLGNEAAAQNLVGNGLRRLRNSPAHYMGLDTGPFAEHITEWMHNRSGAYVRIDLQDAEKRQAMKRAP